MFVILFVFPWRSLRHWAELNDIIRNIFSLKPAFLHSPLTGRDYAHSSPEGIPLEDYVHASPEEIPLEGYAQHDVKYNVRFGNSHPDRSLPSGSRWEKGYGRKKRKMNQVTNHCIRLNYKLMYLSFQM
jgi:hypothetical protein